MTNESIDIIERAMGIRVVTKPNGIGQTMGICAESMAEVYELCAKRFEEAIQVENKLHGDIVKQLQQNVETCRTRGKEVAEWVNRRGQVASDVEQFASKVLQQLEDGV